MKPEIIITGPIKSVPDLIAIKGKTKIMPPIIPLTKATTVIKLELILKTK
jgi:hypothetical protein